MCLMISLNSLSAAQRLCPLSTFQHPSQFHQQSWAQLLYAAAHRFGLSKLNPAFLVQSVVSVQADIGKNGVFVDVQHPYLFNEHDLFYYNGFIKFNRIPLRLILRTPDTPVSHVFTDGVDSWSLSSSIFYSQALLMWTPTLRDACFAALKRLGNARRQLLVLPFLRQAVFEAKNASNGDMSQSSSLRRWAEAKASSYLESYWFLPNCEHSRRLLRARLDCCPTEDYVRRRPSKKCVYLGDGHIPSHAVRAYPRVDDRTRRACYSCATINGVHGVYHPETLEHVLLHCPAYASLRESARASLVSIASSPAAVHVCVAAHVSATPSFTGYTDDVFSTLWTVFRLSSSICSDPPPRPVKAAPPFAPSTADGLLDHAWECRARPEFQYDHAAAQCASRWVAALTSDWLDTLRTRVPSTAEASTPRPGAELAACVASYVWSVFHRRRALTRGSDEFSRRVRDPPLPSTVPVPPGQATALQAPPPPPLQSACPSPSAPFISLLAPTVELAHLDAPESTLPADDELPVSRRTRAASRVELASGRRHVHFCPVVRIATALLPPSLATMSQVV